jgi:exodeoxyribonuclease VII large subunit
VHRVATWWEEIAGSGAHIARRAATVIDAAERRDAAARGRLTAGARNQLVRHGERVERRALQVATQARRRLDAAADAVELRSLRIGPGARRALDRHDDRTAGWRRLLAAYDVDRQLARGYSITMGPDGRVLRASSAVSPGDVLVTRFADGRVRSFVEETVPDDVKGEQP